MLQDRAKKYEVCNLWGLLEPEKLLSQKIANAKILTFRGTVILEGNALIGSFSARFGQFSQQIAVKIAQISKMQSKLE